MQTITANELKMKGVRALDIGLEESDSAIISYRGQDKYVVMKVENYEKLHEAELLLAIERCKKEVEQGQALVQTAEQHLSWIDEQLKDDL